MSIYKTLDSYNSLYTGRLMANAGDWVDAEMRFTQKTYTSSDTTNICSYTSPATGVYQMSFQNFNWMNNGFSVGDELLCRVDLITEVYVNNVASGNLVVTTQEFNVSIASISGNTITLSGQAYNVSAGNNFPLIAPTEFPGTERFGANFGVNGVFKRRYQYRGIAITDTSRPDKVEFQFNLAQDGSTTLNSVIDGEVNKFVANGMISQPVGSPKQMIQSVNKSGGYFKNVSITKTANNADYSTEFSIKYKFFQWGIIQDGFAEPDYYDAADQLVPVAKINTLTVNNGADELITTTSNTDDTGGFNEVFNGGTHPFLVNSMQWYDSGNNPISGMNYSGVSTFRAVINTGGTQTNNHRYRIGLAWRPDDSSYYQNLTTNEGENLLINAPDVDLATNLLALNPYIGETSPSGARWDLSELIFTIVGTTLEVTGKVTPNAACDTLFSTIPDGGRKTTLWLSLGSTPTFIGNTKVVSQYDRVSLILSNEDNIDAPVIGVQIPDILEERLLDHDSNDVTNFTTSNTTTEDDVLYYSEFLVPDNVVYDGLRARLSAFNNITNEEFILENQYISFANVVIQSGQMQPNITLNRGFNLPPTSDRNIISIKRKSSLDISGKYGLRLDYGFLNDWRYWLSQSNVNSFFFDISESLDGKNKNWQNFTSGDWKMRVSFFLDKDGVEDFNHQPFKISPYEDDANVSLSTTIVRLLDNTTITQLLPNELHEVTAVFTWNQNFTDEWVEFTVEDFEGGNRWVMSSILPQGNIISNPLKPIATNSFGLIDVSGTGTTALTCKALVDTNVVNNNDLSMSFRVFSTPNDNLSNENAKQKTDGTYKQKTDGTIKEKS